MAEPLLKLYRRWADGEKLAMATARIALAQPVASLQTFQRELEAYAPPTCLGSSKAALLSLVSNNVRVMIAFMGKEELSSMVYQFVDRAKMVKAFEASVLSARCE
jgi:hypothetical protein